MPRKSKRSTDFSKLLKSTDLAVGTRWQSKAEEGKTKGEQRLPTGEAKLYWRPVPNKLTLFFAIFKVLIASRHVH
jgi:hypothetical protein